MAQTDSRRPRRPLSADPPTFQSENELRNCFEATAPYCLWQRAIKDRVAVFIRETRCSPGRADSLWASYQASTFPKYSCLSAALLQKPTYSRILSLLKPTAGRSEEYLYERTGVARATLRRMLRQLLDEELIVRTDAPDSRFRLGNKFALPHLHLCAFEFKMRDWQRALYQAIRYRSFSHRVYVVMPPQAAANAFRHASAFEATGVGLLSFHPERGAERLVVAACSNPTSRRRFIRAVGLVASVVGQPANHSKSANPSKARSHTAR